MSKVNATLDFSTGTWSFEVESFDSELDIYIGFTSDVSPVKFDNLFFGWAVGEDFDSYPKKGIRYLSTDQPYVEVGRSNVMYDAVANVSVWAENAGIRYEGDVAFVPIPAQPYPSWVYKESGWEPPIPYPGEDFGWDENNLSWVYSPYPEDGGVYQWNTETATWDSVA